MSFLSTLRSRMFRYSVNKTRCLPRSCRLGMESLEDRTVPAGLVWANRGALSDHFQAAFGAQAALARGVVDSALAEWNRVVYGFHGQQFTVNLKIAMDTNNPATSGFAHDVVTADNGRPLSGEITINMALNEMGQSKWFLDPTPDIHEEFQGPLQNAFARNATPGGPAEGMRDLRSLLIHEIGHIMGIAGGTSLIYNNDDITITNTGIADTSTDAVGDTYWLFQGPTVNSLMTNYDILAENYGSAGHNAMPRAGNPQVQFNGATVYSAIDTMQPTGLSVRRVLLTNKTAMMINDMGYDVTMPETFGTFHAFLDNAGKLRIRGGNDDTEINNVNQGDSDDVITINRVGNYVTVSVDIGIDVPGTGSGKTFHDQQDAFTSIFPISKVKSILVEGLGGDDQITIQGNFNFLTGNVQIHGDAGDDTILATSLTNQAVIAYGDSGNDTLRGSSAADQLFGGDGADSIAGNAGNDYILGGDGNDNMIGNQGADTVYGGDGADFIVGGSLIQNPLAPAPSDGNDVLAGDDGNDLVFGDNYFAGAPFSQGTGNDTIHGGAGHDTLHGGLGADTIYGDDGDDVLAGAWGNDVLDGGAGDDSIFGGDGNDRLIGGLDADLLNGGNGADSLYGGLYLVNTPDAGDDVLNGDAGNDYLFGDTFYLGSGSIGGNDTLNGGTGTDYLYGQVGDDILSGGDSTDYLYGGPGEDTLSGNAGNDVLNGDDGRDDLFGNEGGDTLNGGDGEDNLDGGVGNDTMNGGNGDDLLLGQDGTDTLNGGNGDDMIRGGLGNDVLAGNDGNDLMLGEAGRDYLSGGNGRDLLIGGLGSDTCLGGGDEDLLIGGYTSHDNDDAALIAIFNEWRSSHPLSDRVMNLRSQDHPNFQQRLNSRYFLRKGVEVFDTADFNSLQGQAGADWFFFSNADSTDKTKVEVVN